MFLLSLKIIALKGADKPLDLPPKMAEGQLWDFG